MSTNVGEGPITVEEIANASIPMVHIGVIAKLGTPVEVIGGPLVQVSETSSVLEQFLQDTRCYSWMCSAILGCEASLIVCLSRVGRQENLQFFCFHQQTTQNDSLW